MRSSFALGVAALTFFERHLLFSIAESTFAFKSLRQPIVDLVGIDRDQMHRIVSVECDGTASSDQQPALSALLVYAAEPNPYLAQIEKVPSGVMPDIPAS